MKRAFTLIELLVVIAIIAILAAILFPVFAQAKVAAKATQHLSNMKQMMTSTFIYHGDYDDTMISWINRNGLAGGQYYRPDIISWVQQLQPYMKNGAPTDYTTLPANGTNVPPTGMSDGPLWNQASWQLMASKADCDLDDLSGFMPVHQFHAKFSWSFPANNVGYDPGNFAADPSAGTTANPIYAFPGSDTPFRTATTVALNWTMQTTQVQRPGETIVLGDGFSGTVRNGGSPTYLTTFGCETADLYKNGSAFAFMDGHAKFIKGNVERYLTQDNAGLWYKKYLTWDR
ncbi:MAG: prepilin-type N-terminal cleavage/methylation domain-containing protein [Armatimonadetes bacterium]|nr:prepilin-type N-terminal cleavage/methylation domain-containing protein [Armatimonadota bacterium]